MSLFALCGHNLHAADITYRPGATDGGTSFPMVQTITTGSTVQLTNMDVKVSGYVLIGWSTPNIMPIVRTQAVENMIASMPGFSAVGDSLLVTDDITLQAVWARDANNNGLPDYGERIIKPSWDGKERFGVPVDDDDELSLRSGDYPAWTEYYQAYDINAYYDSIYYVGCTYNSDPANGIEDGLIRLDNPRIAFAGQRVEFIAANFPNGVDLFIEYGGVLVDTCMVGGPKEAPMDRIHVPYSVLNAGGGASFTLDSVIDIYPFRFDSIKEDGLGILKMYLVDPVTGLHPSVSDWRWPGFPGTPPAGVTHPFKDPETGIQTDTSIIKFYIYNKPVFESNVIDQHVDLQGNLDIKLLSGTPIKHMARSIDGMRWRSAGSPVTRAEREEIRDSASICLRQLDAGVGYQVFLKQAFLSEEKFSPDDPLNAAALASFEAEQRKNYDDEFYWSLNAADQASVDFWLAMFAVATPFPSAIATDMDYFWLNAALIAALDPVMMPTKPYVPGVVNQIIESMVRDNWHVLGERLSEAVNIPDYCRGVNCFVFKTIPDAVIEREVEIVNTISSVTADPGVGKHYIKSRENFEFTLTFAGGQPLKVIATRVNSGISEELLGTDLGGGKFGYIINQVQEPWSITVTSEPATDNDVITNGRVWTYANTLYISSDKAVRANIYTLSGTLFKQLNVQAGTTSEELERGVYIVEIDGARYKVVVK